VVLGVYQVHDRSPGRVWSIDLTPYSTSRILHSSPGTSQKVPGLFFCSLILYQPGAIQSPSSKPVLMKHVTQSKDLGSLISYQRGAIQSPSSKPVLMKHVTQ
jgi:hypothetical protein